MMRFILALCLAVSVHAKSQKWECATSGNIQTCNLYLDPTGISVTATASPNPQEQANWCWLASIEMAFRYYGYAVPQAKLLDLLWGSIEDMPGGASQIIGATNRVYTDDAGKRFRAQSLEAASWLEAADALSKDIPILVGYSQPGGVGHMTMVVGIQYQFLHSASGQIMDSQVSQVVLWDPWPGVGIRNMSQTEFDNAHTLVAVGATLLDPVTLAKRPKGIPIPSLRFRYDLTGRRLR